MIAILCGNDVTIPTGVAVLGYVGTCITSGCFLPQFIKVIKTRKTSSLSFWMWLLELLGGSVWIIYCLLVGKTFSFKNAGAWLPTLVVNLFIFSFSLPIFTIKTLNVAKAKKQGVTEVELEGWTSVSSQATKTRIFGKRAYTFEDYKKYIGTSLGTSKQIKDRQQLINSINEVLLTTDYKIYDIPENILKVESQRVDEAISRKAKAKEMDKHYYLGVGTPSSYEYQIKAIASKNISIVIAIKEILAKYVEEVERKEAEQYLSNIAATYRVDFENISKMIK